MTIIIAKNNTGSAIFIQDLGIEISGSGFRTLTDTFRKVEIATSTDLPTEVASGDIIINDGTSDLSISDGLAHINFETQYEDVDPTDSTNIIDYKVKISDTDTTQDYLLNKLIGTSGSVTVTIVGAGGNEQLQIDMSALYLPIGVASTFLASSALSSTTSTVFQTKLTITTPAITGTYRIGYSMEYNAAENNKSVEVRLYNVTDGIAISTATQATNNNTNFFTFSGFYHQPLTGISKTFAIQYREVTSTCVVRNAQIEGWRTQ